jgi:hypothetical protein
VQLCYDVCHFALAYESPQMVLNRLEEDGIRIGRLQISAALQAFLPEDLSQRKAIAEQLAAFAESTYLHQVGEMSAENELTRFPDLPEALAQINQPGAREWRTHFHVPIFLEEYGLLQSTQHEITEILRIARQHRITHHLEVETYTWDVLPADLKLD